MTEKIEFLINIYSKFLNENSNILCVGSVSNDNKNVFSQLTNNITYVDLINSPLLNDSSKFTLIKIDTSYFKSTN